MEETQLLKVTTECPGGQWFGKAQPSCKKQPEQKTCAHTCQGHGMGAVGFAVSSQGMTQTLESFGKEGAHRQYCNIYDTTEELLSRNIQEEEMEEFCLYKLDRCSKITRNEQRISGKVKHLTVSL